LSNPKEDNMATIEVHWGDTTCPQCEEVFDGVSTACDTAFELHHEFECPCCGTIIERDITLAEGQAHDA